MKTQQPTLLNGVSLPPYFNEGFSGEADFPPSSLPVHPCAELFCLKEFAVLSPANPNRPLQNESRINIILSSVCIALNATNT